MFENLHISPTSFNLWHKDQDEWKRRYMGKERTGQTQAMVAGTAFDVCIKNYLTTRLLGQEAKYEYKTSVDQNLLGFAIVHGPKLFKHYSETGALAHLLAELSSAAYIRMESTVRGLIGGVPCMGNPDLWFVTRGGVQCTLDFKVNGYVSPTKMSPPKGYLWRVDGAGGIVRQHKGVMPRILMDGIVIDSYYTMDELSNDEAVQLCFYAWLMGASVGSDFVVGLDRVMASYCDEFPARVLKYRNAVSKEFQLDTVDKLKRMYASVNALTPDDFTDTSEARREFSWL
jgi:hypothetical protein